MVTTIIIGGLYSTVLFVAGYKLGRYLEELDRFEVIDEIRKDVDKQHNYISELREELRKEKGKNYGRNKTK